MPENPENLIYPAASCLAAVDRALSATSEEEYEQELGMACFWANINEISTRHGKGDHSKCAHFLLGLDR